MAHIMIKNLLIGLITIIALYFGTGGFIILQNEQLYEKAIALEKNEVISEGIPYYNKEVMIAAKQQDLILEIYPYAEKIPSILSFVLTAISFGIIGAIGKVVNDTILKDAKLNDTNNLLLVPIQGGIIGIIILGISYAIPILLSNDNVSLDPVTIVFLSLFGGIFYLNFYKWFTDVIDKALTKKDKS
jgi:hypothetical protein